jgi:hypothetical protein
MEDNKVIDIKTAEAEFARLCEKLKFREKRIEALSEYRGKDDTPECKKTSPKEDFVELMIDGDFILNDDCQMVYKLEQPIMKGESVILSHVTFRGSRLRYEDMELTQGSGTDVFKNRKLLALMTGANPAFVKKFIFDDIDRLMKLAGLFFPQ